MSVDRSQIKNNLVKVLENSLDATLKESPVERAWNYKEELGVNHFDKTHCVVLTISSFRFRLMIIMHLNFDDRVKEFMADLLGTKKQEVGDDKIIDRLLEMSNSFCGHIKRYLQESNPPLGMSTPNLLDSACLYLDGIIEIDYDAHIKANDSSGGEPLFGVSAIVSVPEGTEFNVNQPPVLAQEGGELESFGELEMF